MVCKREKGEKIVLFCHKAVGRGFIAKRKGCKNCKAAQLLGILAAPKNIAYTERPPKESILEKNEKTQRFKK